ncbi:MAG: transposase [Nitrospirae bacterium]|nr:transposase [Nitrospirota bacterium]
MKKLAGVLTQEHAASPMINYTLKKPTTVATSQTKRYGVVKLTQDVHAHFFVSCVQEESQQPKAPRKTDPKSHLQKVKELVAQSEKVYSCYEAGPTGFSLHRQLTELGVENIVIAPSRLDEQGRRVNTDKSDTLQLAGRLDRYVAGNKRIFTVVRVPTLKEEQRRVWPRQRKQLQGQRLSLASQGRGLVLTQGVSIDNMWWQQAQWKKHQEQLAPWLLAHLEIFRKIILAVDEQIEQIDKKILAERKAKAEAKPKYAGDLSLEVIESEVCDWNRFSSWRKAGSYCGLTGGVSASGQSHSDLSITKVGNRRLRTALIEMAWRLVQHQPNYWLTKKWAPILDPKAKAHRRSRKKAIVAYARQLFVDLWKWKTGRITAEKLGWEMC